MPVKFLKQFLKSPISSSALKIKIFACRQQIIANSFVQSVILNIFAILAQIRATSNSECLHFAFVSQHTYCFMQCTVSAWRPLVGEKSFRDEKF